MILLTGERILKWCFNILQFSTWHSQVGSMSVKQIYNGFTCLPANHFICELAGLIDLGLMTLTVIKQS